MPRPSRTLHIGDAAPAFTTQDAASGRRYALADLMQGHRGLLLVFHRGMW
jgi:hypothetical protein